jgi:hypothetical protein
MSGEMCTSLGNGFSNLMFMLFMCEQKGCTNVSGVVEGDDGLFKMTGDYPGEEDFKKLGLVIKLELHDRLESASFCGLVFDKLDRRNITDPLEVLANLGWTSERYTGASKRTHKALLRSKALSLLYQYPGCPIISVLAKRLLYLTDDVSWYDLRKVHLEERNTYMREQNYEAWRAWQKHKVADAPIGIRTRMLMSDLYGISVPSQLLIERQLEAIELKGYFIPLIHGHMPVGWKHFWGNYIFPEGDVNPNSALMLFDSEKFYEALFTELIPDPIVRSGLVARGLKHPIPKTMATK